MRDKDACGADDSYIHYLKLYFCGSVKAPVMVLIFAAWLLLLSYTMSVVADAFLCPAVQVCLSASMCPMTSPHHWTSRSRLYCIRLPSPQCCQSDPQNGQGINSATEVGSS